MVDPIKSNQTITAIFCGGHHTPALAVEGAWRLQLAKGGIALNLHWIGHRYSMAGDRNLSLEYREITERGLPFYDLLTPKFHGSRKFFFPLPFFFSFLKAFFLIRKLKPRLVFSFGGYLAGPVVLAAWVQGVLCVAHEQTSQAGYANRFLAPFCQKIFISFSSSRKFFSAAKVILRGLPLRPELFEDRGLFRFNNRKPVVYITGGKQGSHRINLIVAQNLADLLTEYNLIHQSGATSFVDDFSHLQKTAARLPSSFRANYFLRQYLTTAEIGSAFSRANVVLSRAGANTVYELAVLKKPAVLVPLPNTSHHEQEANAQILANAGLAEVLPEDLLSGPRLREALTAVSLRRRMPPSPPSPAFPLDAAEKIAQDLTDIFKEK